MTSLGGCYWREDVVKAFSWNDALVCVLYYILLYVLVAIFYITPFDVHIVQDLIDNIDDNIRYDCLYVELKVYVLYLNYIVYYLNFLEL